MTSRAFLEAALCLTILFSVPGVFAEPEYGTAEHVIHIQVQGGMSRYHTFDPKNLTLEETSEFPSPLEDFFRSYAFSSLMPEMAKLRQECLVFRSVEAGRTHVEDTAIYFRRTGYRLRTSFEHPEIGAWCAASVPDGTFYRLNSKKESGAAFFTKKGVTPIAISSVESALQYAKREQAHEARLQLSQSISAAAKRPIAENEITAKTLSSKSFQRAVAAADANQAYAHTYGENEFGKACHLALNLVEVGKATYVEVNSTGWNPEPDSDYSALWEKKVGELDLALATLIHELKLRKMKNRTLVVVTSDFDRYPFLRHGVPAPDVGRSVALLFGGGVIGGRVIGKTDGTGRKTIDGQVTAQQFNSIIARALRIDPFIREFSPNGRPITIANTREPEIKGIFKK